MEELDLRELLQIVIKRWWIIVAAALVCVLSVTFVTFFILVPVYQANTTLYVGKNVEGNAEIAYNDLLIGDRLISDYREFIRSRLVTGQVIKELGLSDMSTAGLASKVSVNSKQNTRIIEITVEDENPELARDIANKTADVFKTQVVTKILDVKNVQIIDVAETPGGPVKPNKQMNVAIALVLGLILGFGIIFLMEYFDKTIKTPDDVKKHLDLPVLGTIPIFPDNWH